MKHDGLKVFAFAETSSTEQIDKAKNCMEGKEIQGRKLRVRSSKDSDKKRDKEKRDAVRMERRRSRSRYKPLKREDTKLHLVAAFHSFLCRQIQHVEEGEQQEFVEQLETAKTALQSAFKLPEDVTKLKVPRDLEDIFFRDVREDIKPETVERYSDNKEDNDDDDNKRKNSANGNDESEETSRDNEDVVGDVYDEENDLDDVLAAAEEGFTLDD